MQQIKDFIVKILNMFSFVFKKRSDLLKALLEFEAIMKRIDNMLKIYEESTKDKSISSEEFLVFIEQIKSLTKELDQAKKTVDNLLK
jgi:hypothetical protein